LLNPKPLPALVSGGQILAEVRGAAALVTLNRPASLNALSLEMFRDLRTLLHHWEGDEAVRAVVVRGSRVEGRPPIFCAGGDIRFLHGAALAGDPRVEDAFNEEYTLVHQVHTYPKPYIALTDGLTMGGGMGISQGAGLRIVTEHSRLAMPETLIGIFPDVAASHFLSRLPGAMGEYLALTGQAIGAGDALALGMADQFTPSGSMAELVEAVAASPDPAAIARSFAQAAPAPVLLAHREAIDHHFGAPDLLSLLASLESDASSFAQEALAQLRERSPLMLAVTLEMIYRGREMSLADALRMERDLMRHCFSPRPGLPSDALEGIRARVVDKDRQPRWNPATQAEVTPEMVAAYFESPWTEAEHPLRHLG